MNEISVAMPFTVIFKNIKEHVEERNPRNVTNVEKPLHVSEVFKFMRRYTVQTPYSQCGNVFYFTVVFL